MFMEFQGQWGREYSTKGPKYGLSENTSTDQEKIENLIS